MKRVLSASCRTEQPALVAQGIEHRFPNPNPTVFSCAAMLRRVASFRCPRWVSTPAVPVPTSHDATSCDPISRTIEENQAVTITHHEPDVAKLLAIEDLDHIYELIDGLTTAAIELQKTQLRFPHEGSLLAEWAVAAGTKLQRESMRR